MNDKQVDYNQQDDYVKTLQQLLNRNGYALEEDGVYGEQTRAAVADYNAKQKTVASNAGQDTTAQTGTAGGFSYGAYTPSDTVQQAQALLQQQMENKPGAYQSQWSDQISGLIDQILNRKDFSYDINGDPLYQQYAQQYMQQGKMAMMDTMGQAQAMTGGYGNSYAQGVGQQAYQGYLQQLNEIMPELYGMAQDQYNQEGQDMLNKLSMLAGQEETEYGRHQDQVSEYYTMLGQLKDDYNAERDYDYGKWAAERDFAYDQHQDELAYEYQVGRDQVADEQWQKEYDESVRRWNFENGITEEDSNGEKEEIQTGNPQVGPENLPDVTDNLSDAGIRMIQKMLNVPQTGKWDEATKAASLALYGDSTAATAYQKLTGGQDLDGDGWADPDLADSDLADSDWAEGIDETINTGGLKGSSWGWTKNNLAGLIRTGNMTGNMTSAYAYMDQIADQLSESQYEELIGMLEKAK